MKYYGTYACGHEGVVEIYGPSKDREWKKENEFSRPCPECRERARQQERDIANKKAAEAATEMGLPKLTGTEKQVAWATTIRNDLINSVNEALQKNPDRKITVAESKIIDINDWGQAFDALVAEKTTAKFWIDNREERGLGKQIIEKCKDMFFGVPKEVQEEIEETVVVAPEDPKKTGVVKIEIKNDYVKIFYPKDSDFREIVKEKEYSWSGTAWEFKKTSTSGELIDRAAEIGNALLANGFTVQFPDEETKNLAISGTFEPKYDNWILLNKSTGKLSIVWKGYNDFLFQKSKLLPGAKWNNGSVLVSAEFYREVEEFAQLMGFRFSQSAIEAIEKYKATEECYEQKKVQEVTSESIDYEEKLRTVLEKEGVIEDLVDD